MNHLTTEVAAERNGPWSLTGRLDHRSGIVVMLDCIKVCDNCACPVGVRHLFGGRVGRTPEPPAEETAEETLADTLEQGDDDGLADSGVAGQDSRPPHPESPPAAGGDDKP